MAELIETLSKRIEELEKALRLANEDGERLAACVEELSRTQSVRHYDCDCLQCGRVTAALAGHETRVKEAQQ